MTLKKMKFMMNCSSNDMDIQKNEKKTFLMNRFNLID